MGSDWPLARPEGDKRPFQQSMDAVFRTFRMTKQVWRPADSSSWPIRMHHRTPIDWGNPNYRRRTATVREVSTRLWARRVEVSTFAWLSQEGSEWTDTLGTYPLMRYT